MPETLSEFMAVRCTATMKQNLESIASKGVNRNVADHVRFAIERYIEGDLLNIEDEEFARIQGELQKVFGDTASKSDVVKKLIQHWDNTKQDSYGYKRFA